MQITTDGPANELRFTALVRALALIKILFCLVAAIGGVVGGGLRPALFLYTAYVVTFAAAGLWLETSERRNRAAQNLAMVFFFAGSAFAEPLILNSRTSVFMPGETGELLLILEPESWLAFFFATFVTEFPKISFPALPQAFQRLTQFTWGLGCILFSVNALRIAVDVRSVLPPLGWLLESDRAEPSLFWAILMTATLPSVAIAVWKTRIAAPQERRRAAFFANGLLLGIAPLLAHLIASGWFRAYGAFLLVPRHEQYAQLIIYPAFLSIPITTAYCVLVYRVFDVRQLVR